MNTEPSEREEAPERLWVWITEPYQWHSTKSAESDVEYVRADLFNAQTEQLKQQASLIEDFRHNRIGDELQRVAEGVRERCVVVVRGFRDRYDKKSQEMNGLHGGEKYGYKSDAASEILRDLESLTLEGKKEQ